MAEDILSEKELLLKAVKSFEKEFGVPPKTAACAPGRVNLIGEHTDYNDGFVLPMALPLLTIVAGRKNNLNRCRIRTFAEKGTDYPRFAEFVIPSESPLKPGVPKWANYIKGVVSLFSESLVPGFDAVIISTIPLGGGLASSAALEVSTHTFLENLTGKFTNNNQMKALICRKAENDYAGVPCGIMDQYISIIGGTMLIDCRTLEFKRLPEFKNTLEVAIIDTNVNHDLTRKEYAVRQSQCRKTADILRKRSLRDTTIDELNDAKDRGRLDDVIFRRGRHVISEIERTKSASDCLFSGDMITFGKLMFDSHTSQSNDFEVSCAEVDKIVEIAKRVNGVLGSRLTGGGFGGCTVTLVNRSATSKLIEEVKANYSGTSTVYIVNPFKGTREMVLDGFTTDL